MTLQQLAAIAPDLKRFNDGVKAARRAYEADQGLAVDYTAAAQHAAANKRYRDRIRNTNQKD